MRILIIRPGAIGDTLLTLPVIQALRIQSGAEHITLVGNADVLPLAQASGIVDTTSSYGLLRWSELFSSTGIQNPTTTTLLQQTDLVICWLRDTEGIVRRNLLATGVQRLIIAPGRPPENEALHITQYLAETVGLTLATPDMLRWQLPPLEQSVRAEESRRGDGLSSPARANPPRGRARTSHRPYEGRFPGKDGEQSDLLEGMNRQVIAIHPGSGGARKCWPVRSFAAVIKRLWQHGYAVLLLAGPAESERLTMLEHSLPSPASPTMLNVLRDAPLLEVARHLRQCQGYLGNDSGITHLAAMLGLPTLALFGPSNPAVWRPLGPKIEVLYDPELAQLSVDLVMEYLDSQSGIHNCT